MPCWTEVAPSSSLLIHIEQRVCPQGMDMGACDSHSKMLEQFGHSHALIPSSDAADVQYNLVIVSTSS